MTKLESTQKLLCEEVMKNPDQVIVALANYKDGCINGEVVFDELMGWIRFLKDNS